MPALQLEQFSFVLKQFSFVWEETWVSEQQTSELDPDKFKLYTFGIGGKYLTSSRLILVFYFLLTLEPEEYRRLNNGQRFVSRQCCEHNSQLLGIKQDNVQHTVIL
jgi:hypothetical protein